MSDILDDAFPDVDPSAITPEHIDTSRGTAEFVKRLETVCEHVRDAADEFSFLSALETADRILQLADNLIPDAPELQPYRAIRRCYEFQYARYAWVRTDFADKQTDGRVMDAVTELRELDQYERDVQSLGPQRRLLADRYTGKRIGDLRKEIRACVEGQLAQAGKRMSATDMFFCGDAAEVLCRMEAFVTERVGKRGRPNDRDRELMAKFVDATDVWADRELDRRQGPPRPDYGNYPDIVLALEDAAARPDSSLERIADLVRAIEETLKISRTDASKKLQLLSGGGQR